MKIRFWGTRGSCPTPSPDTVAFGGNTSCVEIECADGTAIIIDAGTGIRWLGLDYMRRPGATRKLHILISHAHWDHIQGFPFFVPAFIKDFELHFYSSVDIKRSLKKQMSAPFFPISLDMMASKKVFHHSKPDFRLSRDVTVHCLSLKHPQGVSGFRIEKEGKSVVYTSDVEHDEGGPNEELKEFCRGADMVLYDAQYTPEEYAPGRIGWGHSTYEEAVALAKAADVKRLVLFHHEPTHNDDMIREIEKKADALLPGTIAAREGMILEI